MKRSAAFALLAAGLCVGCSGDDDAPAGPCRTRGDCASGRECVDGRCSLASDGGISDGAADLAVPDAAPDVERPDAGPPAGAGCSSDLRDVLGSDGRVLFACPAELACFEGRCSLAPCDAAARSRGTVGCDFHVTSPPSYPGALPPCLAVFVANAWPAPAHLTVSRAGVTFDLSGFARLADNTRPADSWDPLPASGLPEGEVAVLFLSSDPDSVMPENGVPLSCPVTPAVDAGTVVAGSGVGEAFRITSDLPVRAYDILPYGGARSHFPSAELLLPSSAWGLEHVVIDAPPGTHSTPGPLWIHVLALEGSTTVRLSPSVALPAGPGVPAIARDATGSVSLEAGRYVQWEVGASDPSGTLIVADRPVAVWAGNRFLRLQPTPAPGGESTHQQILPVDALASEYVVAPHDTRRLDLAPEIVPYRLVGAFDGTRLELDPPIPGAPESLERGEVADLETDEAFVVRSQDSMHPFALAQLMTTANVEGGSRPGAVAPGYGPWLGDEEMVIVFPPSQYLDTYVFFTDPAYPTTNLVLVRQRGAREFFLPVTIDCLGEIDGWHPIGSAGDYEWTAVDLLRGGMPVGTCANGRHVATSGEAFGLVVWGEDSYSSYAYPAGGNARQLTELPPLF